jgi:hypothetical protein
MGDKSANHIGFGISSKMIDLSIKEDREERGDDRWWVSIIIWAHEETIPLNGRLNGRHCQWFFPFLVVSKT